MVSKTKRILIIEDEKPIAKALERKLGVEGFSVDVVSNGQNGLKQVGTTQYDIILCDLVMPKGDGFFFLEEMKKRGNHTPVIITTNLNQGDDKAKTISLGAKGFFVKSNTPISEIVDYVRNFGN